MNSEAIILAGGLGSRLHPHTLSRPKCLTEIHGRPIIIRLIDQMLKSGVRKFIVVTGYKAEELKKTLQSHYGTTVNIVFVHNDHYDSSGPAEGLRLGLKYSNSEVLYLNGDVVCEDIVIQKLVHSQTKNLTAITESVWEADEVNVIFDVKTLKLLELGKHVTRQASQGEFIGITKFDVKFSNTLMKILDMYNKNSEMKKFASDALNDTISSGHTMSVMKFSNTSLMEIDYPKDLERALTTFKQ